MHPNVVDALADLHVVEVASSLKLYILHSFEKKNKQRNRVNPTALQVLKGEFFCFEQSRVRS